MALSSILSGLSDEELAELLSRQINETTQGFFGRRVPWRERDRFCAADGRFYVPTQIDDRTSIVNGPETMAERNSKPVGGGRIE